MGYLMRVDAGKLIQFIVCQAMEFGASLTPIKVVKFLYLADVYYARENKGKTLTGWPWKFAKYEEGRSGGKVDENSKS